MFKLFEWIGSIIAIACLIEIASNPKQVVRDIQNGPAPHLAKFNDGLMKPGHVYRKKLESTRSQMITSPNGGE